MTKNHEESWPQFWERIRRGRVENPLSSVLVFKPENDGHGWSSRVFVGGKEVDFLFHGGMSEMEIGQYEYLVKMAAIFQAIKNSFPSERKDVTP